jgi:hypothetical protein
VKLSFKIDNACSVSKSKSFPTWQNSVISFLIRGCRISGFTGLVWIIENAHLCMELSDSVRVQEYIFLEISFREF